MTVQKIGYQWVVTVGDTHHYFLTQHKALVFIKGL